MQNLKHTLLFIILYFFSITHTLSKDYDILEKGDPDLNEEKKISKSDTLKRQKEINIKSFFKKKSSQTIFRMNQDLNQNSKICFIGDSGNGSKRQKDIAELLIKKACTQIRHLGDIIYYIGVKDLDDIKLKSRFLDVYKEVKAPMHLVIGNHDYYQNPDLWLDIALQSNGKYLFPNNYYLQIYNDKNATKKGICFLALDSTPFNETNDLKTPRVIEQLNWLDKEIIPIISSSCSFTIALLHHPYVLVQENRTKKNSDLLSVELYQKRLLTFVDLIVAGHDHYLAYFPKLAKNPLMLNPKKDDDLYNVAQIISGSAGMLQRAAMEKRNYGHAVSETGFVIMSFNFDSSSKKSPNVFFNFFDHRGKSLFQNTLTL